MKPSKNFRSKRKKKEKKSFFNIIIQKAQNSFALLLNYFILLIETFQNIVEKLFFKKYPYLLGRSFEILQLTLIYFFPICSLVLSSYKIVGQDYGYIIEFLVPYCNIILSSKFIQFFSNPNQTFLFYYLAFNAILQARTYKVTTLVKFNLLFSVSLEMFHNLILMYLDIFLFLQNSLGEIYALVPLTDIAYVYTVVFVIWYFIYILCYITALRGKFPYLGNSDFLGFFQRIIDSIAFWVKVKRIK